MTDFISLTCPSCGGKLKITSEIERFACVFCGNEYLVKRGDGIVTLAPVIDQIKTMNQGIDKTNAELAMLRLREDIRQLEKRKSAILRKRKAGIQGLASAATVLLFSWVSFSVSVSQSKGFFLFLVILAVLVILVFSFIVARLNQEYKKGKKEIKLKESQINKYLQRINY